MTPKPSQLAGILPGNFPSNHVCRAARQTKKVRNRTVRNTLLKPTASNHYIKMPTLGWPGSCNAEIKVTSAELASQAHVIRPLL